MIEELCLQCRHEYDSITIVGSRIRMCLLGPNKIEAGIPTFMHRWWPWLLLPKKIKYLHDAAWQGTVFALLSTSKRCMSSSNWLSSNNTWNANYKKLWGIEFFSFQPLQYSMRRDEHCVSNNCIFHKGFYFITLLFAIWYSYLPKYIITI